MDAPDVKIPSFPYRFMAVDAGSNAIKFRAWEIEEDGAPREIAERRYPIRLGQGTFRTGLLGEKDVEAAAQAFKEIGRQAAALGVGTLRAVATSAMREASNSLAVVGQVRREAGLSLEILPAAEEARLIALGVLGAQPQRSAQYLIVDIGGGSTEIILAHGPGVVSALSLRLGAVRLREMFFPQSPPPPAQIALAEAHIHDVLLQTLRLPPLDPDLKCLGSGGTIIAIQAMVAALPGPSAQGGAIGQAALEALLEKLTTLSLNEIVRAYHLDAPRAEIILPGVLVLRAIVRSLKVDGVWPVRGGVSDGLLHDFLERAGLRAPRLFDRDRA